MGNVSAYRRIGVSAYRRIGVSAYRRIGVSAYRRIGVSACRRVGVSACRRVGVSACRRIGVSAFVQGRVRLRPNRASRVAPPCGVIPHVETIGERTYWQWFPYSFSHLCVSSFGVIDLDAMIHRIFG
jgi:hypothetical protein